MPNEQILLDPSFDLGAALESKKNKKKQMTVVDTPEYAKNILDARFESIRSYLHSRSDKLTVLFQFHQDTLTWQIGLVLPWCDAIYGVPPSDPSLDKAFAITLYDEWLMGCNMGEKAYRLRHVTQDGYIKGT